MDRNVTDKESSNLRQHGDGKSLYAALSEYGDSDYYPYHMPGHKRSKSAGEMARYYGIDITEIDGFDDLHHAEGILRDAEERANRLYGAEETYYLVNGSTCGVLASIMTVTERGSELLIARNCHKSVYHAAILQELTLHYYYPPLLEEYGICDGVAADGIARLLDEHPFCQAVVVTSPTYEGIVSDIQAIADAVHEKGKILIVDEAHGAHFGLDASMPRGAVECGADLVIHSLHKTLPAMTQTALIHVQGDRVDRRKLREYLRMLQTSSPSYVMMASMDACVRYVEEHGAERFAFMRHQYDLFCNKMERCRHIRIGEMTEMSQKNCFFTDWDIGKLVISVRHTSVSGRRLYDVLREEYHLQPEMAVSDYVLAIMTIMDTEEGWQRLADALLQIDGRIEEEKMIDTVDGRCIAAKEIQISNTAPMPAAVSMTAACAFHKDREEVPLAESEGRVVADFINLYPPGIPILVPGEVISKETLMQIEEHLRAGLQVRGVTAEGKVSVVL
ncbi:MAG: aminotransferase class V-fold PLP-dependent enzyme [Lachnospiraceae bacterium]|nr:aminotransferase class V-fold PLP-dependent enzyme [Lachnospiraceae bacterium]